MNSSETSDTSFGDNSRTRNQTEDFTTFKEEVEDYFTFRIASEINKYYFPIFVPIGLVGNTLSFLVMIKPNNRKVSTCIYMAAISIIDNLVVGVLLYNVIMRKVAFLDWNPVQCRTVTYLTAVFLQSSRYQVLAMTIDKYVAIKWPHRAATYSTSKRAKSVVIGVFSCTLIYNSHHIPMTGLVRGRCKPYSFGGIISVILTWMSFSVNGVIPISMLMFMNYVIVRTVRRSRKLFESNSVKTNLKHVPNTNRTIEARQKKMKSVENQLTTMLLLVTTLFLILQIPTYIRYMYISFVRQGTPSKYAASILFSTITYALSISNNGINLFLYCVSGKKFRDDLMEVLCGIEKTKMTSTSPKKSEPDSDDVFTLSVSQNTLNSNIQSYHKCSIR